tara:strand:- start:1134 stop:2306 length:1173 start_codon:yes stop_codon:yes gene_type:complete
MRMLFQTLDNKNGCISYYHDGKFLQDLNNNCKLTWRQSSQFVNNDIDYVQIYVGGQNLDDVCPDHLKQDWLKMQEKMKSFYISFQESKINLQDVCFYDLLPQKFLKKYCEAKNEICNSIIESYTKPKNYDMMKSIVNLVSEIESRDLNLDWDNLKLTNIKARSLHKKKSFIPSRVSYDPWKTVTGRLATVQNSFPILTINKESRSIIKPRNDLFLELDYNSAELRTAFGLLKMEQPSIDIHDWILENIFNAKITREKSKEKTFAWLYNAKASNKKLEKILDKEKILDFHYDGQFVETIYDRKIEVDQRKALNYIVQSTTSDLVLKQAIKINKLLGKSFIAFIVHDSVVIDVDRSDQSKLNEIIDVFSKTDLGTFKTNIAMGKNFGDMRKV